MAREKKDHSPYFQIAISLGHREVAIKSASFIYCYLSRFISVIKF